MMENYCKVASKKNAEMKLFESVNEENYWENPTNLLALNYLNI